MQARNIIHFATLFLPVIGLTMGTGTDNQLYFDNGSESKNCLSMEKLMYFLTINSVLSISRNFHVQ